MNTDKLLKGLIVAGAVVLAVALLTGCSKSGGVTGPSVQDSPVSTEREQPNNLDTTPAAAPTIDIKIRNDGTVINNTQVTYTACLFDAPYGEGILVEQFKASPGITNISYKVPGCDPKVGQIDIIKGQCPTKPHGLEAFAANPKVNIPATDPVCEECVEEAKIIKKEIIDETPWTECAPTDPTVSSSFVSSLCVRTREITYEYTWEQCDTLWTTTETLPETEECACEENECEAIPAEGTTLSWTGAGDPDTECAAFGDFTSSGKIDYSTRIEGDFYICKAGNDREVMYEYPTGSTCSNGKDISHVTACVCDDDD